MTDLDARYGRRSRRSDHRVLWAWVGVALAIGIVGAYAAWVWAARDPYSTQIRGFSVVSDSLVTVEVEIVNDADVPVRCEVVTKDTKTLPVGTAVVEGPARSRVVAPVEVATLGRAVVAVVGDCGLVEARVP